MNVVAPEVAAYVRTWREECPELWTRDKRQIDATALREALGQADRLHLDPYLVAYAVMGAEWLFRARPLMLRDLEADLDELEERLCRSAIADARPHLASLLVGSIARALAGGLKGTRYYVALGEWATPIAGWRHLVAVQERDQKKKTVAAPREPAKSGQIPALSPVIAGLVVEGLAERVCGAGRGGTALALKVASILRGRRIQSGEFGIWRRGALGPAPDLPTGVAGDPAPADLREWLLRRWKSAYEMCFDERKRTWSAFLVEAAHNPYSVFGPLANPEALTHLYAIPWSQDLSPKRKPMVRTRRRPVLQG